LAIARAELAVQLAGPEQPALADRARSHCPRLPVVHSADLTVKFWLHLRDARLAPSAGSS
jgi:hypothetical protein